MAPEELLEGLTPPQREAVLHVDGPALVLAGAGSGKTRVITRRIANLVLSVGIAPWHVLAITFTNKAAGEMTHRVGQMLSPRQAQAVTLSTFHSLCARLLRIYSHVLDLPRGFSIYDSADQSKAMKSAIEALDIRTDNFPPGKMLHTISHAKNELVTPEAYAAAAGGFYEKTVAKIYARYQQTLTQNKALDFDDLLLNTVRLLREFPDVAAELRQRYQYILIDEYQDTNHAQFVLAHALAAGLQNLMVTGDPDQSIYAWRGADIRNILEFERHYPDAKVIRLEQNYRSTKRILQVADALIRHNVQRKHKDLWTDNEQGAPVTVVTTYSERDEAHWVVDHFRDLHIREGIPWSGFAVFYRVNNLSRVVEDALRDAAIPYQIARGTAFYERKEIKDAVGYLRVIANPADEVNLARVINTPARGISAATIKSMQAQAAARGVTLWEVVRQPQSVAALSTRAVASVAAFAALVRQWRVAAGLEENPTAPIKVDSDEHALRRFVENVLRESGLQEHYRIDKSDPEGDRLANLGEMVSSAQQYEQDALMMGVDEAPALSARLLGLLERISLVSDVDSVQSDQGAVTLMTLHAAKGLEFPVVAMIGVEDGLIPHQRAEESPQQLEEERRLCFVGITRARRVLVMSRARFRTVFGQTMPTLPSRFFSELPREALQTLDESQEPTDTIHSAAMLQQRSEAQRRAAEYPPGTLVRHPMFGLGRVLQISPQGPQTRARVEFNTAGVKNLILEYANLQRV
jgi:DNA helicase-2/ATP-dependent DNA helicase PcrA